MQSSLKMLQDARHRDLTSPGYPILRRQCPSLYFWPTATVIHHGSRASQNFNVSLIKTLLYASLFVPAASWTLRRCLGLCVVLQGVCCVRFVVLPDSSSIFKERKSDCPPAWLKGYVCAVLPEISPQVSTIFTPLAVWATIYKIIKPTQYRQVPNYSNLISPSASWELGLLQCGYLHASVLLPLFLYYKYTETFLKKQHYLLFFSLFFKPLYRHRRMRHGIL